MLEAIALGIPTISTDCPIGGAKMVIEDHTNGILVPVGNVEQLSQAMQEVLEDENLSKKMSLNGVKIKRKIQR